MKEMRRKAAVIFKGPLGSPVSEDVDTRGIESNISDTNSNIQTSCSLPTGFCVRLLLEDWRSCVEIEYWWIAVCC